MPEDQKTNRPLISIITPSFNQGRFIEETIKSILEQDYPNIEHIVVDGGSTDNTVEILKKYDGKIKWISEKDKGQSDALNKGFGMAKGEILGWLNSDDMYLPGTISKIMNYFETHPDVGMVYGKTYFTDEFGVITDSFPTEPFNLKKLAWFNFIAQSSAFYRKRVYFDSGGVDLNLRYVIDYDMWPRMARITRIEYLPDFFSKYRLHAESGSVSEKHLLKSWKESIDTALKYFNWAPVNRVYIYCFYLVKSKLPSFLSRFRFLVISLASIVTIAEYLRLNKRIRVEDIKMIRVGNLMKMVKKSRASND